MPPSCLDSPGCTLSMRATAVGPVQLPEPAGRAAAPDLRLHLPAGGRSQAGGRPPPRAARPLLEAGADRWVASAPGKVPRVIFRWQHFPSPQPLPPPRRYHAVTCRRAAQPVRCRKLLGHGVCNPVPGVKCRRALEADTLPAGLVRPDSERYIGQPTTTHNTHLRNAHTISGPARLPRAARPTNVLQLLPAARRQPRGRPTALVRPARSRGPSPSTLPRRRTHARR